MLCVFPMYFLYKIFLKKDPLFFYNSLGTKHVTVKSFNSWASLKDIAENILEIFFM